MERDRLGHFSLLEKIGEGGMGRVYKAHDSRLERLVAIKLLPERPLTDSGRRDRFLKEARAASSLNHANIITVHEIGEHDGQTFIVMELVEGKPLNDLIPSKGMRLTDALRIGTQIADALTAAHAAGIIHRDLKPANIMVDSHGRVKVLDFGLAKLSPAAVAAGAEDATQTIIAAQLRTEEGVLLGSIPYMSPEQAEGKPVDARSDIFSFGAVLYEMITGRRAFRGESRVSTLTAVVEKEPESISSISETVPPELERLIGRCLRKDIARRSQHMADVKLALEELRDESESGSFTRAVTATPAARRQWWWAAIATAAIALAFAALWVYANRRSGSLAIGELTRVSPDDGHAYAVGSLSPDGKFIIYVSDRSGKRELWLQQIAGGEPIQLTHEKGELAAVRFFPDGSHLLFGAVLPNGTGVISEIPILGGTPRVVATPKFLLAGDLSHDGRRVMYIESDGPRSPPHMMVLDLEGGQPRELTAWQKTQAASNYVPAAIWSSDDRSVLCTGVAHSGASDAGEGEWFAIPVDGGDARPTGAGVALRAAGLKFAAPAQAVRRSQSAGADRILFAAGKTDHTNIWEIRLSPDSMRVRGAPRQLTFGTESQSPTSVAGGMVAMDVARASTDLYLLPLSPDTGQPTGPVRRLTRDGRTKIPYAAGGNTGQVYFTVLDRGGEIRNDFAVDLETSAQTLVAPGLDHSTFIVISQNGQKVAFSVTEGDRISLHVGDAGGGLAASRPLCQGCGRAVRFSADGRYLIFQPEARAKPDPKRKYTLRLMDLATARDSPWLEQPTESIVAAGVFGADSQWIAVRLDTPATGASRWAIVPWRPEPVPASEWIEARAVPAAANFATRGNYFQFYSGDKLVAVRFDPKTRSVSDPYEVKLPPDTIKSTDQRLLRGRGMVFARPEFTSSVWMMKLPE